MKFRHGLLDAARDLGIALLFAGLTFLLLYGSAILGQQKTLLTALSACAVGICAIISIFVSVASFMIFLENIYLIKLPKSDLEERINSDS